MVIAYVDSLCLVTCAGWLELWLVWARDPRALCVGTVPGWLPGAEVGMGQGVPGLSMQRAPCKDS